MESAAFEAVPGTRFDCVKWVAETGSTNTDLITAARRGDPEGCVLIADLQTSGRGRRGREWIAPAGTALMMSVLLRPPGDRLDTAYAGLITLSFAAAAAAACMDLYGLELGLKWPNDLVVDALSGPMPPGDPGYRKVAGVLAEAVVDGETLTGVVIGMGLNTSWTEVPQDLELLATSLALLTRDEVDRVPLAERILVEFESRYSDLLTPGGKGRTLAEARDRSVTLATRVRVGLAAEGSEWSGASIVGLATDIDDHGRLVVTGDDGRESAITVGDVAHLRRDGL